MSLPIPLTAFTLAEARDAVQAKKISSSELTAAFVKAVEEARPLNAFITETPANRRLTWPTRSDARIAQGEVRRARRPAARDQGPVLHQGRAHHRGQPSILGNFVPPYESTVTQNLWDAGAVMLGKTNMDEFAMGSSNETSYFGPVFNPWRASELATPIWCRAARRAVRRPRSRTISVSPQPAPTPAVRSASLPPSPARSASSRLMAAARAGASSPSLRRSTRPVR